MKRALLLPILFLAIQCGNPGKDNQVKDWLLDRSGFVSSVSETPDGKGVIMTNGLVTREFRTTPNLSTINIVNETTGQSLLRTACPEGTLTINGKDYPLGGLDGIEEISHRPLDNNLIRIDGDKLMLVPHDGTASLDIRIYNIQGQMVFRDSLSNNNSTIELPMLPHGIYVVATEQGSKTIKIQH